MHIVGILGSERINGKVATMLSLLLNNLKDKKHTVDQINLHDFNMKYCSGCMQCRTTRRCVIQDDFQGIYERFMQADVVVLAAPVYWANVPAIVKNFFDRLSGTSMESKKNCFPKPLLVGKRYIGITSCNTPFPFNILYGQSSRCHKAMREFFYYSGIKKIAEITLAGTWDLQELPATIHKKISRVADKV